MQFLTLKKYTPGFFLANFNKLLSGTNLNKYMVNIFSAEKNANPGKCQLFMVRIFVSLLREPTTDFHRVVFVSQGRKS